ncbi:MAG: hypothetical protein ABI217_05930, partial [Chthoniobacterales bacterium]
RLRGGHERGHDQSWKKEKSAQGTKKNGIMAVIDVLSKLFDASVRCGIQRRTICVRSKADVDFWGGEMEENDGEMSF